MSTLKTKRKKYSPAVLEIRHLAVDAGLDYKGAQKDIAEAMGIEKQSVYHAFSGARETDAYIAIVERIKVFLTEIIGENRFKRPMEIDGCMDYKSRYEAEKAEKERLLGIIETLVGAKDIAVGQ